MNNYYPTENFNQKLEDIKREVNTHYGDIKPIWHHNLDLSDTDYYYLCSLSTEEIHKIHPKIDIIIEQLFYLSKNTDSRKDHYPKYLPEILDLDEIKNDSDKKYLEGLDIPWHIYGGEPFVLYFYSDPACWRYTFVLNKYRSFSTYEEVNMLLAFALKLKFILILSSRNQSKNFELQSKEHWNSYEENLKLKNSLEIELRKQQQSIKKVSKI